jgi:glycosyltransferase involved in cell wall biosynthesis
VKNVTNIITVHDLMFYKVPQFFSTNRFVNFCAKFYYQILVGISLRNADIIVSVSKTTSNDLHCIYGLDSIVIGEGVFNFKIGDNNSIERLNILSSYCLSPKDYFLYIGNNRRHKNIKFLISAFMASNTCHKLVLVGFTESKFERNSKIINISSVTDDELAAFYINCVAFIFPSLYEGFGLPILEAIKHRCVVLSSNGGALEEFNFKSIHFFDPKSEYELVELINCSDKFAFDDYDVKLLTSYDSQIFFERFHRYLIKYLDNDRVNS